jgi:hypothetical protein
MTEHELLPPGEPPAGTARRDLWQLSRWCWLPPRRSSRSSSRYCSSSRNQLVRLREAQAPQLQEAKQFRERLQTMGSETAWLANGGAAPAKKIVDAMKQQGVTLEASGK